MLVSVCFAPGRPGSRFIRGAACFTAAVAFGRATCPGRLTFMAAAGWSLLMTETLGRPVLTAADLAAMIWPVCSALTARFTRLPGCAVSDWRAVFGSPFMVAAFISSAIWRTRGWRSLFKSVVTGRSVVLSAPVPAFWSAASIRGFLSIGALWPDLAFFNFNTVEAPWAASAFFRIRIPLPLPRLSAASAWEATATFVEF